MKTPGRELPGLVAVAGRGEAPNTPPSHPPAVAELLLVVAPAQRGPGQATAVAPGCQGSFAWGLVGSGQAQKAPVLPHKEKPHSGWPQGGRGGGGWSGELCPGCLSFASLLFLTFFFSSPCFHHLLVFSSSSCHHLFLASSCRHLLGHCLLLLISPGAPSLPGLLPSTFLAAAFSSSCRLLFLAALSPLFSSSSSSSSDQSEMTWGHAACHHLYFRAGGALLPLHPSAGRSMLMSPAWDRLGMEAPAQATRPPSLWPRMSPQASKDQRS